MLPFSGSSNYATFKSATGRAPASWSLWADWGSGSGNPSTFPTAQVDELHRNGTVPMIFWQPVGTGPAGHPLQTSCGTDYSWIINGGWDDYIHSWANAAKGHGRILLRFAHEMDGSWFPYGDSRCTNTTTKFKAMWRHVVGIFRHDGATNVKFVWSPLVATTGTKSLYPGNSWVDYVGFSAFNWAKSKHRPWLSLATLVQRATTGLTKYSNRPWIITEMGSVHQSGQSRPSWLKAGYTAVYKSFPRIKLMVYFNIDMRNSAHDQPNWQLSTRADVKAYKALLAQAKFRGVVN